MTSFEIGPADPATPAVHDLLEAHLEFAKSVTPPDDVFALDKDARQNDKLSYFSARHNDSLVGVGALHELDSTHVEIKSMHTATQWRGRGVARAVLNHLIDTARERGYQRISLETGPMEAFSPARSLYSSAGFVSTEPFADYGPRSVCMTLML